MEPDRIRELLTAEGFTTLFEHHPQGIFVFTPDRRFVCGNPAMVGRLGRSSEDLSLLTFGAGIAESDRERALDEFDEARSGSVRDFVATGIRSDGSTVRSSLRLVPFAHDNAVIAVIGFARDIGDLERANAQLAAQAALLDNARDAIVVRELDSAVRYWNRSASRIYGWSVDEVRGHRARELLYTDTSQYDHAFTATMEAGHWSGELRQVSKAGAEIVVDSSWTLTLGADGSPESIFTVSTDITERKRRELLELRTQRMESLGTLASGIAHDLNNVLTPILMAVQLLRSTESDPTKTELLRSTELAVKRGADMIRQVLSFATGASGRRDPIDLRALLAELELICSDTLPADISVTFDVRTELWGTLGDSTQLLQVLLNLVTNARDAMPSGGHLTVRAHNTTLRDTYSSVSHLAAPGNYAVIEVEDNGAGIDPSVLDKIFEPFFTTKETGSGTGLGLSTSIAIVRGHGGYMQAYSEPGNGSLFRIHLLADDQPQDVAPVEAHHDTEEFPHGDGELILVVDDEAAIRQLTRQTLEAYGYTTVGASNGAEAVDFVDSAQASVALVLTDMAMPVMDGASTAAYLLKQHPGLPVIAASGLNANGGVARAASLGVRAFLSKPYTTGELLEAVDAALHAGEGGT